MRPRAISLSRSMRIFNIFPKKYRHFWNESNEATMSFADGGISAAKAYFGAGRHPLRITLSAKLPDFRFTISARHSGRTDGRLSRTCDSWEKAIDMFQSMPR